MRAIIEQVNAEDGIRGRRLIASVATEEVARLRSHDGPPQTLEKNCVIYFRPDA